MLLLTSALRAQEEYTFTGEYQGKNIYIQNPLTADKVNFCTQAVFLNEQLVIRSPKTSAYSIDLGHLQLGAPVFIKIVHAEGCVPKVINPQVIRSKSKFQFLSTTIDAISVNWVSKGELPNGKFFLEHYKGKSWKIVQTITGKGSFESNQYTVLPDHHTGDNRYRVKYLQSDGQIFFSRVFDYFYDTDPVSFYPTRVDDHITLSRETDYEIVDSFGNSVAQGRAKEIDLPGNLKSGLYYLHIDNRQEKFVKK